MAGLYEPPDIFERAADVIGGASDKLISTANNLTGLARGNDPFNPAREAPSASGSTTRQGQVKSGRAAVAKRQTMRFIVPEQPIVEMYINPENIQYQFSKLVSPQRAKGGYILQYWGENLGTLSVKGTTGTSGIEGINVLYDVYRNEQLMFDPYALTLAAERDKAEQSSFDDLLFGDGDLFGLSDTIVGEMASMSGDYLSSAQAQNVINARSKPTLAQLAFTVEIYWFGEIYRGYFENFNFTESVTNLGIFEYSFTFKVTQRRGFRTNYLAWHKDPNEGMSNWGSGGPKPSYSSLTTFAAPVGTKVRNIASSTNKNILNNAIAELESLIDPFDIL